MSIPSPRGKNSRVSCRLPDTRNLLGTSANVFDRLRARDGPSSALFENSKNLASSSCGLRQSDTGKIMEQGEGVRREPQGCTIPTPRFAMIPALEIVLEELILTVV